MLYLIYSRKLLVTSAWNISNIHFWTCKHTPFSYNSETTCLVLCSPPCATITALICQSMDMDPLEVPGVVWHWDPGCRPRWIRFILVHPVDA